MTRTPSPKPCNPWRLSRLQRKAHGRQCCPLRFPRVRGFVPRAPGAIQHDSRHERRDDDRAFSALPPGLQGVLAARDTEPMTFPYLPLPL